MNLSGEVRPNGGDGGRDRARFSCKEAAGYRGGGCLPLWVARGPVGPPFLGWMRRAGGVWRPFVGSVTKNRRFPMGENNYLMELLQRSYKLISTDQFFYHSHILTETLGARQLIKLIEYVSASIKPSTERRIF